MKKNWPVFVLGIKFSIFYKKLNFYLNSFTLLNKVGSIAILNNTSINNEFAFNTFYYYRLKIFNKTKLALVKTNVTLFLNVLHFPSYLLEYKMDTILISSDIFTFLQLTNETDANGEITVG